MAFNTEHQSDSVCGSSKSIWSISSIDALAEAVFLWSRKDLRHDTWVSMEKHLLCDRTCSVSLLSSPTPEMIETPPTQTHTHTSVTCNNWESCLIEDKGSTGACWGDRYVPHLTKLCVIHTPLLLSTFIDLRCTTQIQFCSLDGCLFYLVMIWFFLEWRNWLDWHQNQ